MTSSTRDSAVSSVDVAPATPVLDSVPLEYAAMLAQDGALEPPPERQFHSSSTPVSPYDMEPVAKAKRYL